MKTRVGSLFALFAFFAALEPAHAAPADKDCLACHGEKDLTAATDRGKRLKLYVPPDALKGSAHEGMSCTDCHTGAASFENVPHAAGPLKLGCATCHEKEERLYMETDAHGKGFKAKSPRAPYCNGCHGGHQILPMSSPNSAMAPQNEPETCGRCHASEELNKEEDIAKRNLITRYKQSVHWQGIKEGKNAATCTSCHSAHSILRSDSPASTTSRTGIIEVCQRCHLKEAQAYKAGGHGRTLLHGNHDVPTCVTCHGDHDMTSLRGRAGDARTWASTQVCIWCHGNERMMKRYALDTAPVDSYLKDFHGLTQRGTLGSSATCADCHDAHHSLPSSHPKSRMHISNRGAACGQCHGQVSPSFIMSFSHKVAAAAKEFWVQGVVRNIYIIIIVLTIGAMLLHNFVVWWWAVQKKLEAGRTAKTVRRMTPFEIGLHAVLLVSFIVLAVTGFMLKVPDAFWVRWLFSFGVTEAVRSLVHRASAVLMTLDFAVLFLYLFNNPRGRGVLYELVPSWRDLRELLGTLRFYRGKSAERPRFGVFNYAEKAEFWALVWGTGIMAVTGFVLWFPKSVPSTWPGWIIEVARTIHFYEAVLAVLSILVWHLFMTIWHPDEYPMNTSWLTGKLTREEAEHRFTEEAINKMEPPRKQA
jgi:cytochrome b subunit of formate dehydrogenase